MIFSKEDLKRIGKNIAAIREAYGFSNAIDFALAINNAVCPISDSMIQKIEAAAYPLREGHVRTLSAITGFPTEDIIFHDLTYLEKGSLKFKIPYDIVEILNGENFREYGMEISDIIFPFVTSEDAEKSKEFKEAYDICINKIGRFNFEENDVVHVINKSCAAQKEEGFVNILSALGRLYVGYVSNYFMYADYEDKISKELDLINFNIAMQRSIANANVDFLRRKEYFLNERKYNVILTTYMKKLAKSARYFDFVYYFLALRYYYGIMDNSITKMSEEEMNIFGKSMLDSLNAMENKYAVNFKKYSLNKE